MTSRPASPKIAGVRWAWIGLGLCGWLGCIDPVVPPPLQPPTGALTALVGWIDRFGQVESEVHRVEDLAGLTHRSVAGALEMELRYYRCASEVLDFEPGTCLVPTQQAWRSDGGDWTRLVGGSTECDRCEAWRFHRLSQLEAGASNFEDRVVALGAERAVLLRSGRLLLASGGLILPLEADDSVLVRGLSPGAGDDFLYLRGEEVRRGVLDGDQLKSELLAPNARSSSDRVQLLELEGGLSSRGFLVDGQGLLLAWDSAGARELLPPRPDRSTVDIALGPWRGAPDDRMERHGGAVVVGPGVAVDQSATTYLLVDAGSDRVESKPLSEARNVAVLPGLGPVVSSDRRGLLLAETGALLDPLPDLKAERLVAVDGAFLIADNRGETQGWVEGPGLCPEAAFLGGDVISIDARPGEVAVLTVAGTLSFLRSTRRDQHCDLPP